MLHTEAEVEMVNLRVYTVVCARGFEKNFWTLSVEKRKNLLSKVRWREGRVY